MGNSNSTAEEGISKLIKNKSLITKYLNKSVLNKNFMNNRILNVKVPGNEIEQNSSFYIYNIEGFFDIEKGIYFSLIQLLEIIQLSEENNIQIKDYKDLELKVYNFMCALQLVNTICNLSSSKTIISEQEKKDNCVCVCTMTEEKKTQSFDFSLNNILNISWNKREEKTLKQEEKKNLENEINNIDFSNIPTILSLVVILNEILKPCIGKIKNSRLKKTIDWLSNIIPFDELKEIAYYSLRAISGTLSGITNILNGISNFKNNKILSILNVTTGLLEFGKVGIDSLITYNKYKTLKSTKKRTKAQDNFLKLTNKMELLFIELIKSNFEGLKTNNIIILGIDESEGNYNEGTDLQLCKIDNIDNYAKCLNDNEEDRVKYIKNMIYFYNNILPKFSQLTEKEGKDKKESFDFLLTLQEFIIENCNNKDFWIKINQEYIEKFIDNMEKVYENGKKYFKDNGNEIKKKIIESLEKEGEKTQIKKKTLNSCKSVSNIKDCKPPAPIIDTEDSELKTSGIYIKKNMKNYKKYSLKNSRKLMRKNTEESPENYIIQKDKNEY